MSFLTGFGVACATADGCWMVSGDPSFWMTDEKLSTGWNGTRFWWRWLSFFGYSEGQDAWTGKFSVAGAVAGEVGKADCS